VQPATQDRRPVKLIMFDPRFFFIPSKKIKVESDAVANRTYFLHDGRIVAVGKTEGESQ
jgi:hypothetical protein